MNVEQREAIEDYLKTRPNAMSSQIRQIRLRAKRLVANEVFAAMEADIELLRRLATLKVAKGRKALDVKAKFSVRHPSSVDVKSSFVARQPS